MRDLTTGVDTEAADGRATLPLSSSSHMITYKFDNGANATVRGSGTEPKIKWYAELVGNDRAAAIAKLGALVGALVEEVLQFAKSEAHGLEMRK